MNKMNLIDWSNGWVTISLVISLLGYLISGFGSIGRGRQKELIKFVGIVFIIISFILMLFNFGVKGIILILLSLFVIAPASGFLIGTMNEKVYDNYKKL